MRIRFTIPHLDQFCDKDIITAVAIHEAISLKHDLNPRRPDEFHDGPDALEPGRLTHPRDSCEALPRRLAVVERMDRLGRDIAEKDDSILGAVEYLGYRVEDAALEI